MPEPFILAAIAGTFLIAGTVKGVIGVGLPTVSLGLMTIVLDLPAAMALLLVPSLITNLWQAAAGDFHSVRLSNIPQQVNKADVSRPSQIFRQQRQCRPIHGRPQGMDQARF